jgi:hypothetical protein
VEGVEESAVDEVGGPDWREVSAVYEEWGEWMLRTHRRRLDEETTSDTTDGEADELGGHDD